MKLVSVQLENFYSFRKIDSVTFQNMNLFLGKNNSGKSNLLKTIRFLLNDAFVQFGNDSSGNDFRLWDASKMTGFDENIPFNKRKDFKLSFSVILEFDNREVEFLSKGLPVSESSFSENRDQIVFLFGLSSNKQVSFSGGIESFIERGVPRVKFFFGKVEFPMLSQDYGILFDDDSRQALVLVDGQLDRRVYRQMHLESQYSQNDGDVKRLFNAFMGNYSEYVKNGHLIQFVKAMRGAGEYELSASPSANSEENLVNALMSFRDGNKEGRSKFKLIKKLIRELAFSDLKEGDEFELLLPRKERSSTFHIGIEEGGKVLPLSSFGSGIEQVISMVVDIVKHGDSRIILFEEPEAHLHPGLQKKFIRFLCTEEALRKNQYFIASHSNILINEIAEKENSCIFGIKTEKTGIAYGIKEVETTSQSRISPIKDEKSALDALKLLGVCPSDILQTNGIIWVEGISDKLYIQHWIKLYCEKKGLSAELLDFQILLYGGSILSSHDFSFSEDDWEQVSSELIEVSKVNPNMFVVMDRDGFDEVSTKNVGKEVAKQRVYSDLGENKCWVTLGKEIEFYLPDKKLEKICNKGKLKKDLRKKDIAKEAIDEYGSYSDWFRDDNDLEKQIKKLIENIQNWKNE